MSILAYDFGETYYNSIKFFKGPVYNFNNCITGVAGNKAFKATDHYINLSNTNAVGLMIGRKFHLMT